jgi:hypothetical protein
MKKLLVAVAAVLVTAATYGQGQVNFNNFSQKGGQGAPIFLPGSTTTGPGAQGIAGLYTVANGLETLQATAPFFTGAGADFFISLANSQGNADGTVTLTGIPESTAGVNFVIRSWDKSFATEALAQAGGGFYGDQSFLGDVGASTLPPNNLNNFTGFTLQQVPEPSTIAFGVIGGLALLLRRRK